jgi:hypothetical protein
MPVRFLPKAMRGLAIANFSNTEEDRQDTDSGNQNGPHWSAWPFPCSIITVIYLIPALKIVFTFADRQNSKKTTFEVEAGAKHLENSVTPAAGQR